MDETTFRILDALSRDLGNPISINELTSRIKGLYGTAYYKNIYDKIHDLRKQNILIISEIGKSSIIKLNFSNYLLTDILAEMELKRKQDFLEKRTELQMLLLEMTTYFSQGFYFIKSISLINPDDNVKLNRAEFLFLLAEPLQRTNDGKPEPEEKRETAIHNEIQGIYSAMGKLQSIHNTKTDYLILKENEFLELLKSEESNPLKEMLSNKIAFYSPQSFWIEIKSALMKGIQIKMEKEEKNPAKMSEQELINNLSRFGYKELGPKISQGKDICIELIITSILLKNDARRIEAIPTLLAKNKTNHSLLMFLCQKYAQLDKLFGLLRILNKIKRSKEIENTMMILKDMRLKEARFDEKSIKQKMRLYNVIG
jgi:hypothetical protein